MPNEHKGHRGRVRDRVSKEGLDNFQDYQVLEYVLTFVIPYKDTNPIAHKLINKFGSLSGVLEADEEDLMTVEGIGEVVAHFLSNILKVFHFYEKNKVHNTVIITSPIQAYNFAKPFLKGKLIEEIYLICLTPNNKVYSVEKIAEGSSVEVSIPIRLISDKMAKAKVSNIIIAHNHPKGHAQPSHDDNKFTRALVSSLTINGSYLLDHIIIGEEHDDYYSYRESGLIDTYKDEISELVHFTKVAQPMAKYEVNNDKKR